MGSTDLRAVNPGMIRDGATMSVDALRLQLLSTVTERSKWQLLRPSQH